MITSSTVMKTPDGAFTIIAGSSSVLASGWTEDRTALLQLIHPSLRSAGEDNLRNRDTNVTILSNAQQAVTAYYDGDHAALDAVPVQQTSGAFRQHAWDVLRRVKPGSPLTYAQYAARTGNPAAVRAAAGACAMNAAALFVPCHRIVRSDGTLGGFRYGLGIKQSLLEREDTGE